jgi:hypothetical protein
MRYEQIVHFIGSRIRIVPQPLRYRVSVNEEPFISGLSNDALSIESMQFIWKGVAARDICLEGVRTVTSALTKAAEPRTWNWTVDSWNTKQKCCALKGDARFQILDTMNTLTTWHPLSAKVDTNLTNKRRSLGRSCSDLRRSTGLCRKKWREVEEVWRCGDLILRAEGSWR